MSFKKKYTQAVTPSRMRRLLRWFGPYLGASVKVDYIAEDWKTVRVSMSLRWFNTNAVGTHFGGSLYSMIDPHFMLMLMQLLGKDYIVWDKSACIDFVKPGTGTVSATMQISDDQITEIIEATADGKKYLPRYCVDIVDAENQLVARAEKTLYIRRKKTSPNSP